MKRQQLGNVTRPLVREGIERYFQALSSGVPSLPSPDGIRVAIDSEVRYPLKLETGIAAEKMADLNLLDEVKRESEAKRSG